MLRKVIIEQISRLIHNGLYSDDTDISDNLINLYVNQGVAIAAKNNYKEAIQLDGIGYINNSFYTTYKGISVVSDEENLWTLPLPQIPIAIGRNEGISRLLFKNSQNNLSFDAIPLPANQLAFTRSMRPIPNKILYYSEGGDAKVITAINMTEYKASVTMISGGDSTNMNSTINLPDDAIPAVIDYVMKLLVSELKMKADNTNDGVSS